MLCLIILILTLNNRMMVTGRLSHPENVALLRYRL